jgi:hypothetical protein
MDDLPFLVLDLSLDVVDSIRRFDLEGDGLAGQCLNKDLHATTEAKDEMKRGLLLNVVIRKGAAILELLSSEDEALLVGRDSETKWSANYATDNDGDEDSPFLVLDLSLDIIDGIGGLDLEGDGLSSEGLYEDLHDDWGGRDGMK